MSCINVRLLHFGLIMGPRIEHITMVPTVRESSTCWPWKEIDEASADVNSGNATVLIPSSPHSFHSRLQLLEPTMPVNLLFLSELMIGDAKCMG